MASRAGSTGGAGGKSVWARSEGTGAGAHRQASRHMASAASVAAHAKIILFHLQRGDDVLHRGALGGVDVQAGAHQVGHQLGSFAGDAAHSKLQQLQVVSQAAGVQRCSVGWMSCKGGWPPAGRVGRAPMVCLTALTPHNTAVNCTQACPPPFLRTGCRGSGRARAPRACKSPTALRGRAWTGTACEM